MATRRERVVLELEDRFTAPMIKAATATQLLDKNLDHLSGRAIQSSKATRDIERETDNLGKTSRKTEKDIDKLSGRLRILTDVATILAPTIAPIGAVAVPAISGLASAFGFAAVGAGTAIVAFQGVGDALKAVNKAQLEPTTANLNSARAALEGLSPAAADFVQQIQHMMPGLKALRDTAAEGLFPGLTAGLDALDTAFPRVQNIFEAISTELGNIAQETGESLASDRWAPFLDFIATEGPSALGQLADAVGNTAHAFAGLWMSTTPLNQDFLGWLVQATADLDEWSNKLGSTSGFKDFVSYIEQTGPQVAETFGAIANAAVQILQAIAPLGGPVLHVIEALADAIAAIADSPIGTPLFGVVAALALINRSMAITAALSKATFGGPAVAAIAANEAALSKVGITASRTQKAMGLLGKAFVGLAAFQLADDAFGLSRTEAQIHRMTSLLDAKAGPNINDQIAATQEAIRQQQQTADNANVHINLGFTDIYSSDKAAKAADNVIGLKSHLADLKNQQEINEATAAHGAGAFDEYGNAIDDAASSADTLTQAITRAQNVLSGRGAEVEYAASIDAMSESLKKNGKTLDITTEKGRANRTALDGIAAGALNLADKIQDPKLKWDFLDNARTQFVRAGKAAGLTSKQARDLATKVGLLNTVKGTAKVDVDGVAESFNKIDSVQSRLDNMRDRTVRVTTELLTRKPRNPDGSINLTNPALSADGGSVPKTGKPYADRHLYVLADGEEVISNRHGQADRNRGLLKAINDNRLAGGGTVNPYGTVNVSGTGSGSGSSSSAGGGRGSSSGSKSGSKSGSRGSKAAAKGKNKALTTALDRFEDAVKKSTKAIDDERSKRDDLVSKRNDLISTIKTALTRDIFGQDRTEVSVWASNKDRRAAMNKDFGQTPLDTLRADIANAKAFTAAEKTLQSKGLNDKAYQALVETGDLDQVKAFASKSKKELDEYERLFNQRDKLTTGAGKVSGNFLYTKKIDAANSELRAMKSELKQQNAALKRLEALEKKNPHATGAAVGKAISGVGPRRGKRTS